MSVRFFLVDVYVSTVLVVGFLALLQEALPEDSIKGQVPGRRLLVSLVTAWLVCLLALRSSSVGTDLVRYVPFFQDVLESAEESRYGSAYIVLNRATRSLTDNVHVYLAIVAILCILPIAFTIRHYSANPLLSLTLYVAMQHYAFTFSGLRQGIAFGLTMLGYHFIRQKQPVRFVLMVILAALFHSSALVFLPAYWMHKIRVNRISAMVALFVLCAVIVFRSEMYLWIVNNIYDMYEVIASESYNWLLLNAALFFGCLLVYKSLVDRLPEATGLYALVFLGVALMLFASLGTNTMRVADYYSRFLVLLIPEALTCVKDPALRSVVVFVVIAGAVALTVNLTAESAFGLVPYVWFWDD